MHWLRRPLEVKKFLAKLPTPYFAPLLVNLEISPRTKVDLGGSYNKIPGPIGGWVEALGACGPVLYKDARDIGGLVCSYDDGVVNAWIAEAVLSRGIRPFGPVEFNYEVYKEYGAHGGELCNSERIKPLETVSLVTELEPARAALCLGYRIVTSEFSIFGFDEDIFLTSSGTKTSKEIIRTLINQDSYVIITKE
jgi:hypothetical protein